MKWTTDPYRNFNREYAEHGWRVQQVSMIESEDPMIIVVLFEVILWNEWESIIPVEFARRAASGWI